MPVYTPSEADRERLREPRGPVCDGEELAAHLRDEEYHRLIAVGDRVSHDLTGAGIVPDIVVTDGREQRQALDREQPDAWDDRLDLAADNPAGAITEAAWNRARAAVAHTCPTHLHIDGEEDLLALPLLLHASPDSRLVYGQRDAGAVVLTPDASLEAFVRDLMDLQRYEHVLVGGTWDRFHAGHRYMLLAAFEHGRHVTVGVTTDAYAREHADHALDTYANRRAAVTAFLDTFHRADRATVVPLDDPAGPAAHAGDALLTTPDNLEAAKAVNRDRRRDGRHPLDIAALEPLAAQDGGALSSTRIREDTVDRDGRPNG